MLQCEIQSIQMLNHSKTFTFYQWQSNRQSKSIYRRFSTLDWNSFIEHSDERCKKIKQKLFHWSTQKPSKKRKKSNDLHLFSIMCVLLHSIQLCFFYCCLRPLILSVCVIFIGIHWMCSRVCRSIQLNFITWAHTICVNKIGSLFR